MISPAIYLIKVILISGILFSYYAFALRNERFHDWNRYYLLFSVAASLVIPFIRWSALFSQYFTAEPVYVTRLQTFTLAGSGAGTAHAGLSAGQWMGIFYGLVACTFIIGIAASLIKINARIRKGKKKVFPSFTLVINPKTTSPFSFFYFVFWSDHIPIASREGRHILHHELAHVQEKHSVDKLLLEIVAALFWINPFFYLIRRELHMIHEFIADRKACEHKAPHEYATLLVEQALRPGTIAITNPFFKRQLSRRVHMLIRENKNHLTYLKRIMAIPVTLSVLFCFLYLQSHAAEKKQSLLNEVHQTIASTLDARPAIPGITPTEKQEEKEQDSKDSSSLKHVILSALRHDNDDTKNAGSNDPKVFTFVEVMPSFLGGQQALMHYLNTHVHYPEIARKNDVQGTVVVQFIVGTDGKLRDIKTVGPHKGNGLEQEAIRVVKNMPSWIPGKQNSRLVAVQYNLPIRFILKNIPPPPPPPPMPSIVPAADSIGETAIPPTQNNGRTFTFVEHMPAFPGGEAALMRYLNAHIRYPSAAREEGIQGTVLVQFIVDASGALHNIHTIGTTKGGGLEDEAVRVVKSMPLWKPGMQNGTKVAVQYNLPIRYVLQ